MLFEVFSSKFAIVHANMILCCCRTIEEISLKTMEYSPVLMQVLLTLLSDDDSVVARQSIVAGTHIFCKVLDELVLQVCFVFMSRYFRLFLNDELTSHTLVIYSTCPLWDLNPQPLGDGYHYNKPCYH